MCLFNDFSLLENTPKTTFTIIKLIIDILVL